MGILQNILRKKSNDPADIAKKNRSVVIPMQTSEPQKKLADETPYLFIDVETPNRANDSICQIAAIRIDRNRKEVTRYVSYIDPQAEFDVTNISIHGITPVHVQGFPTFADAWGSTLSQLFLGSIVVAHNASFDLSVIGKALKSAGCHFPQIRYICTLEYAKDCLPDSDSYSLNGLCKYLSVPIDKHHDAVCDAQACSGIFWNLIKTGQPKIKRFSQSDIRDTVIRKYEPKESAKSKSAKMLKSCMKAAMEDNRITVDECIMIQQLLASNEEIRKSAFLAKMAESIQKFLEDGWISDKESSELISLFKLYINPLSADDGTIEFTDKNFMVTGDFSHGSREEVITHIERKGATMLKSVTKSCDYLVVGDEGSELWTFGNYGTKVMKALDWHAKGTPIKIVSEKTLYQ